MYYSTTCDRRDVGEFVSFGIFSLSRCDKYFDLVDFVIFFFFYCNSSHIFLEINHWNW